MFEPNFWNWALALHVSVSDQILSIQPQYLRHGEVENPLMCTTVHSATSKSKKVIVPCNFISRGLDTFRLVWLVLPCVQTNTGMREEGFCLSDQAPPSTIFETLGTGLTQPASQRERVTEACHSSLHLSLFNVVSTVRRSLIPNVATTTHETAV